MLPTPMASTRFSHWNRTLRDPPSWCPLGIVISRVVMGVLLHLSRYDCDVACCSVLRSASRSSEDVTNWTCCIWASSSRTASWLFIIWTRNVSCQQVLRNEKSGAIRKAHGQPNKVHLFLRHSWVAKERKLRVQPFYCVHHRRRQIFGGAKDFCPNFPKLAQNVFVRLLPTNLKTSVFFCKWWAPFFLDFQGICPDLQRFFPDFQQIKTFGGALSTPPPTPLHILYFRKSACFHTWTFEACSGNPLF